MPQLAVSTDIAVPKPLYSQVRDMLALRISTGEWRPGGTLPNETTLASSFGVSIGTIRRAVEGLEEMGLVVRRQGRGTYVGGLGTATAADRLSRLRTPAGGPLKLTHQLDAQTRRVATAAEVALLQLGGPSEVLELRSTVWSRAQRIGTETSILPGLIAASLKQDPADASSLYGLLASSGVLVTTAEETVSASGADPITAQSLSVAVGAPMLEIRRLAFGIDQRLVELRHSRYLGQHVSYTNRIV